MWMQRTELSSPKWVQERYGENPQVLVHETSPSALFSHARNTGFEKSLRMPPFPQSEKGRTEGNFSL